LLLRWRLLLLIWQAWCHGNHAGMLLLLWLWNRLIDRRLLCTSQARVLIKLLLLMLCLSLIKILILAIYLGVL
jgi:hypothetical protein